MTLYRSAREIDAGPRSEPAGAVAVTGQLPAAQAVEFGNELQKPMRGRMDVRAQGGNLIAQIFDGIGVRTDDPVPCSANLTKHERCAAQLNPPIWIIRNDLPKYKGGFGALSNAA